MNSFFLVMIRDTQVWCDHFVLISPERYNVIIKLLAHIAMAVFPNVNGLLLVWGGGGGGGGQVKECMAIMYCVLCLRESSNPF